MSHPCCHPCRMRFAPAAATYLTACPECGLSLTPMDGAESLVGFRLFDPRDLADTVDEALAVSLPTEPDGGPRR